MLALIVRKTHAGANLRADFNCLRKVFGERAGAATLLSRASVRLLGIE